MLSDHQIRHGLWLWKGYHPRNSLPKDFKLWTLISISIALEELWLEHGRLLFIYGFLWQLLRSNGHLQGQRMWEGSTVEMGIRFDVLHETTAIATGCHQHLGDKWVKTLGWESSRGMKEECIYCYIYILYDIHIMIYVYIYKWYIYIYDILAQALARDIRLRGPPREGSLPCS